VGNALFWALLLLTILLGMVNRRAFVVLIVAMAGIPLTMLTGDTKYFVAIGGMAGVAVWSFAIVIGCFAALIASMGKLPELIVRTPAFFLFMLLAVVSLTWADSFLYGVRMLAKYSVPMLFFWVLLVTRPDASLIRRLESALYFTCVVAAILAFANTLSGGVIAPLPAKHGILGIPALATPYASAANFSFLVVCGALAAYCRFLQSHRALHLLLAAFLFACVALAFVRNSIAGAVLGVAVIHLSRARAVATPVFIAIAIVVSVLIVTSDAFMQRMFFVPERVQWSALVTDPDKFLANVNTSGRTMLWARAHRAFADKSSWVGAGAGAVDAWIKTEDSFHSELHSEVYRIRLELGWVGLSIYLLGLGSLWLRILRDVRRTTPDTLTISARVSGALIPVYLLTLLTDNTLNYAAGFGVLVYGFAAQALVERARRPTGAAHEIVARKADSLLVHGSGATAN